jgi:hypothetical protein
VEHEGEKKGLTRNQFGMAQAPIEFQSDKSGVSFCWHTLKPVLLFGINFEMAPSTGLSLEAVDWQNLTPIPPLITGY